MAMLIRELPRGCVWGFFTEQRRWMNLTQIESWLPVNTPRNKLLRFVIRLERDGHWCFEPQTPLSPALTRRLRARFDRHRADIEAAWVHYLIARGWLVLATEGRDAYLVVHPGTTDERRARLPRYLHWRGKQRAELRLQPERKVLVATFASRGNPQSVEWPIADWLWAD